MEAGTSKSESVFAKSKKKVAFDTFSEILETHVEVDEQNEELTKREKIQTQIKKKKECDERAQRIVLHLIEPGIQANYLVENAGLISPNHWEDIVEERKLTKICGWVMCDNPITNIPRQQFSIRSNQVFDITERKSFCSSHCYAISNDFKDQLMISPLWLRDKEPTPEFKILTDSSVQLHGIDLRLNKLNIDNDVEDEDDEDDE